MPLSMLYLAPEIAAREDAARVIEAVRASGKDSPIIWLTSNAYFPPLREIGSADKFYSGSFWNPSQAWEVYVETFNSEVERANVLVDAPEWDNALYGVDLTIWRYREDIEEEDCDELGQEWERIADGSTFDPLEVVIGCEGCGGYKFAGQRYCAHCQPAKASA